MKEEVGETINYKNESLNYSIEVLKSGKPLKYFKTHQSEAELYGRGNGHSANQMMIANLAYADENRDEKYRVGNTQEDDGWNFRGKGFIQLTGRTNYEGANKAIQNRLANENITNIVNNPESIISSIRMAMISSMGYWIDHNVNSVTDSAGWSRDNVNQITNIVRYYVALAQK